MSQEKEIIRVYVNPRNEEVDEWEVPAESGNRIGVGSSPETSDQGASSDE